MSQPLLNVFQAHTVRMKQTRAAMPEIVKADFPQPVLLQYQREMLGDVSRLYQLSDFVDVDVTEVLLVIHPAAQLSVCLLLGFQAIQKFLERRHQRQRPIAGFGLGPVFLNDRAFPVHTDLRYRVANGQRLLLKVDSVPFEPDCLASA